MAGGCNICDPDLRQAVTAGQAVTFDLKDGNCVVCDSRPRIRAMARMIDTHGTELCRRLGIYGTAHALLAAAVTAERQLLKPLIGSAETFSLFGKYGPDHLQCDVTDLAPFKDGSFDLFEACSVLDYVPELGQAIGSIARVLKRRAVVFIHYSDNRLLDGAQPPRIKTHRSNWKADYYPEGYRQPVMKVGREWFAAEWPRHGFSVEQVVWKEAGAGDSITWWICWRDGR